MILAERVDKSLPIHASAAENLVRMTAYPSKIWTRRWRRTTVILGIAAASMLFGGNAMAQNKKCASLRAQLDKAQVSPVSSSEYESYRRAVLDQEEQIRRTNRLSYKNGCGGLFASSKRCNKILSTLDKMSDNLAELKRERDRLSPRSKSGNADIIRAKLQKSGCNNADEENVEAQGAVEGESPEEAKQAKLETTAKNYDELLLTSKKERAVRFSTELGGSEIAPLPGGNFRTLCVRTCDGYYFPISFSVSPSRFETDEQICQQMCPGAETELYYHRSNVPAETAISYRTDRPYKKMPTAFLYRKKISQECSCKKAAPGGSFLSGPGNGSGLKQMAGGREASLYEATDNVIFRVAVPTPRVSHSLDPETITNQLAGFGLSDVKAFGKMEVEAESLSPSVNQSEQAVSAVSAKDSKTSDEDKGKDGARKKIRIVGQPFFPDQ